jgi:hypothetical protein
VPELRKIIVLPGCGHWIQPKRPAEVSAPSLEFFPVRIEPDCR